MKRIKIFNAVAIGMPILFGLLGFIWKECWGIALLSTMLTGLLQVVAALLYYGEHPESMHIKIYFAGVVLFFTLWFALPVDINTIILIFPPALCIYLCLIIYIENPD